MKLIAYLVPPGTPRCESWGKASLIATGCVIDGRRLPFAMFLAPENGAPASWTKVPAREDLPDGFPVPVDMGHACALPSGRTAEWVSWSPDDGKSWDPEKVAVRVAAVLAWHYSEAKK